MIIYIAGPMTGYPDWNRSRFKSAESRLSWGGHTVLNPARHIPMWNPEAITHEQYMKIAFAMIDACDTIYLLDGWRDSKGAIQEYNYAVQYDKRVLFEERRDAL